jgi:hypothetical protein
MNKKEKDLEDFKKKMVEEAAKRGTRVVIKSKPKHTA